MWELVRANRQRATMIVIVMILLLAGLGYVLGEYVVHGAGLAGLFIAVCVWAALALITFTSGDSVLLSLAKARRIDKQHHPVLYNVVEEMCIASGLAKMPAIYIIDDPAPNAFAVGREPERASVAVTSGLLETLNRDELQGVVAHELGHIKNRDVLYMTTLTIMVGSITLLAAVARRMLFARGGSRRRTSAGRGGGQGELIILAVAIVLMILAPFIAQLLYFAASRRREYIADGCSALFTRYPEGLASALEKISGSTDRLASANAATAPMFLVNPLKVTKAGLADLTSTHPPISQRIKILRAMGGEAGLTRYDQAFRKVTGRPVGVVPRSHQDGMAAKVRAATAAEEGGVAEERRQRVRTTTDALWQLNGYDFVACDCGTQLKSPPVYKGQTIGCPHCGRPHMLGMAAG
jgi:heat shock protein HtpX